MILRRLSQVDMENPLWGEDLIAFERTRHKQLDAKVARVDSLNPIHEVSVKGGGNVHHWRERLDTRAEVVMEDEEDFPVLVAQGKLYYLAASGDKALMQRIMDLLIEEAGLQTLTLPAGVRCRKRGGFRIYFNYADNAATLIPALDETGYVVRYERGNFQSGYCILEERKVVVLNKFLQMEGRINTLMDIVPQLNITPDLLSPEARKTYLELLAKFEEEEK